jgi:hypothetical protein
VYTDLLQHIDVDSDGLGQRRRASAEDVEVHKKSMRFSFRRNIIPSKMASSSRSSVSSGVGEDGSSTPTFKSTDHLYDEDHDPNNVSAPVEHESRDVPNSNNDFFHRSSAGNFLLGNDDSISDLAGAFRILAATRSPDKEGDNFGAVATREDGSVCGINRARALERRVVELVAVIGEIVVNGGGAVSSSRTGSSAMQSIRTDSVFEYFCEKCILSLLVDIAKEKRHKREALGKTTESPLHGVVWSGLVKAQVYETVSLLVSDVRNQSIIYYLLSNNYINELVKCMQPIQQWTEPAIAKMLPAYVDLLKNLTLQLADDPHLFPFLTIENNTEQNEEDHDKNSTYNVQFPLFTAALQTVNNYYAQSDSQIYATCLAIIINLMQIPHRPIQDWMNNSNVSQRTLAEHLCERLLNRFSRITYLTTGPVVDGARHNAIAGQLSCLKDHMGMIHEVFWSGVRGLDVRLCESLLQRVVAVLLRNLSPDRPFLTVGLIDADVIPEPEALAQVSTVVFCSMFSNLSYVPLQRMLAVALLHPRSTPIWTNMQWINQMDSPDTYVFMPALSDIVNNEESRETCPNAYRQELLNALQGDYGEWRTAAAACLMQSVLSADAMDSDSLTMLGVISSVEEDPTSLEKSVATFLTRSHHPSAVSTKALECMGHLCLLILYSDLLMGCSVEREDIEARIERILHKSPIWNAMLEARHSFCEKALQYSEVTGVSDLFLDLMEAAIKSRYQARYSESGSSYFTCLVNRKGHVDFAMDADILVRPMRGVSLNDVETTRFCINMGLHFRALCRVIDRLCFELKRTVKSTSNVYPLEGIKLDLVDKADDLSKMVGALFQRPEVGTDLDLAGRMFFPFQVSRKSDVTDTGSPKGSVGVFRSSTHFMLVLDPTDIAVVNPVKKMEENRGTVLFSLSLRSVIAAAADGEWLHVAVRCRDIGFLIKNGNMALKFESPGTCLIVKQYLDRSREVLRQDLLAKVPDLLCASEIQGE